jgi:hypothetical protein
MLPRKGTRKAAVIFFSHGRWARPFPQNAAAGCSIRAEFFSFFLCMCPVHRCREVLWYLGPESLPRALLQTHGVKFMRIVFNSDDNSFRCRPTIWVGVSRYPHRLNPAPRNWNATPNCISPQGLLVATIRDEPYSSNTVCDCSEVKAYPTCNAVNIPTSMVGYLSDDTAFRCCYPTDGRTNRRITGAKQKRFTVAAYRMKEAAN